MSHALVVRLDNVGDVLLAGPAVRAVAAGVDRVSMWCGPAGAPAAALLPGVDDVVEHRAAWIDGSAPAPDREATMAFVDDLAARRVDQALVLTSFHQSPLPAAMLLRLAGVGTVAAISDDHPGALLDVRHRIDDDVHEVERALSLAATLGHRLPAGDHGGLEVTLPGHVVVPDVPAPAVVVHPGASVPARAWHADHHRALVALLSDAGWTPVVTGGRGERALTRHVADGAAGHAVDLGGRTDLAQLAGVIASSDAVVTGNTGPAHVAAAVGTPVVSLFAPTVPSRRWRPWGVRHRLLGDHHIACAGCRATRCPVPGHPCLSGVTAVDVLAALRALLADKDHRDPPTVVRRPVEATR